MFKNSISMWILVWKRMPSDILFMGDTFAWADASQIFHWKIVFTILFASDIIPSVAANFYYVSVINSLKFHNLSFN